MEDKKLLPVSAIAEVLYCPRNFYFRMVEGADEVNHHLMEGRIQEEQRESRQRQNRGGIYQTRSVPVSSEYYGITGILDVLEESNDAVYPVEYKKGTMRDSISYDVQLCCQALLLEESLDRHIPEGYIYFAESARRKKVLFTKELRDFTLQTIEEARRILDDLVPPPPANDQRCAGCSLIDRCLPAETGYLANGKGQPRRVTPSANLGRVLYIDTPGAYLRKRDSCCKVTRDNETLKEIPISAVDQVVMVGSVNASGQMLEELLIRKIPVYFATSRGRLLGWLQPAWGKNSLLRIKQVRFLDDPEGRLALAKQFIIGKLKNERTLLMRYNRSLKSEDIQQKYEFIYRMIKNIDRQTNIDELMGIEGTGSRAYFEAFPKLIKNPEFFFTERNRRPPRDPVNTLLSFGYMMLHNDIISAIMQTGLDPYIGYLHSTVYGRPALALDLMEEFRSIIVDSSVLTAINTGMVHSSDFEIDQMGCRLKESGRKAFFQAYRNRLNEEIIHPVFEYKLTYRRVIELQARFLAKVIRGEFGEYIPFVVR